MTLEEVKAILKEEIKKKLKLVIEEERWPGYQKTDIVVKYDGEEIDRICIS